MSRWGETVTDSEKKLILREPYLKASQAALEAARAQREAAEVAHRNALAACEKAEAALERARLNLSWTTINAPFDAVVLNKNVGAGSYVSSGNPIATLVNTDRYWIEVSVSVDNLKWITTKQGNGHQGSKAKVHYETAWGSDAFRAGRVVEIGPAIETEGLMAKVIVEVEDPCCLQPENRDKPRLLLDSCVNVHIEGKPIAGVVKVPRTALRDGDSAWVLAQQNTLEVRPVTIVARAPEYVLVGDGLTSGMRLITSDIPTAIDGMKLREHANQKKRP